LIAFLILTNISDIGSVIDIFKTPNLIYDFGFTILDLKS